MSDRLRLSAPAKLNLFLHVVGRRADGYHLLQTVFQLLDFGDELEFEDAPDGTITLQSDYTEVPPEQNLVVRAARLLALRHAPGRGTRIALGKRIPSGGGLGGGSSDAATTLLALNHLWGCGLGLDALAALGLELGADVPVFVRGRSCWAEGVGERLAPLALPAHWYLVLWPRCAVNTAVIFADRELTRNTPLTTMAAFFAGMCHNDCEPVVRQRYPEVDRALEWLSRHGTARMSGTGSCVFAACPDEAAARRAASTVPEGWEWFVARGIDRSPVHVALGC
jgi:4-diphosphocytidyl-2-C-methyl-D-erythritol kinase